MLENLEPYQETMNEGNKNILVSSVGSSMHIMDRTLSSTHMTYLSRTFDNSLLATNHSGTSNDKNNGFNYPLYVATPIGTVILIMLLIFLILFIRRSVRKRQLRRDLLPHYTYDNSEAEVFDGYTQFADGQDGADRRSQDSARSKITADSTGKSSLSLEVAACSHSEDRSDGASSPTQLLDSMTM